MTLWQIYVAGNNKTYVRLYIVPEAALKQKNVRLLTAFFGRKFH